MTKVRTKIQNEKIYKSDNKKTNDGFNIIFIAVLIPF